ncbi:hypothetical protein TRFO_03896 [Tritrichomonas foetus]|uniref:Uncharacterized protein n=1 Tax=Tritrichomonas foetus TaxID=1144522 RepID=A0A1J4KK48_9EUKA|nr:hypothetical protein TRFO_03896 [Tritrichomonas foetus]|eukprot:OHT11673.1 hypothetical protein TRFO_03896 [Tritrichomonas foetus]
MTFPPSKKVDVPPADKKINFNSNIVDLRLRKLTEQHNQTLASLNDSIAQRVEEMAEILKSSTVNLDDVFMPGQVDRPEVPKYLANIYEDQKRDSMRKKTRVEPMDMAKIQNEYKERLRAAEMRGTDRLRRRIEKTMSSGATTAKNTYRSDKVDDMDYRKRAIEQKKIKQERREKLMNYIKPEEYKMHAKESS